VTLSQKTAKVTRKQISAQWTLTSNKEKQKEKMPPTTSSQETEWDYSGRMGRDGKARK